MLQIEMEGFLKKKIHSLYNGGEGTLGSPFILIIRIEKFLIYLSLYCDKK